MDACRRRFAGADKTASGASNEVVVADWIYHRLMEWENVRLPSTARGQRSTVRGGQLLTQAWREMTPRRILWVTRTVLSRSCPVVSHRHGCNGMHVSCQERIWTCQRVSRFKEIYDDEGSRLLSSASDTPTRQAPSITSIPTHCGNQSKHTYPNTITRQFTADRPDSVAHVPWHHFVIMSYHPQLALHCTSVEAKYRIPHCVDYCLHLFIQQWLEWLKLLNHRNSFHSYGASFAI